MQKVGQEEPGGAPGRGGRELQSVRLCYSPSAAWAGDGLPRPAVTPGWWPPQLQCASTPACRGHGMHTDTSPHPELTPSEAKPCWSLGCRDVVFHCTEGGIEAQSGEAACPKPAAMVGGERADAAVPAGGWSLSHMGGSWHTGRWPWPLAPSGWQSVPKDCSHTWSVERGPHGPDPGREDDG